MGFFNQAAAKANRLMRVKQVELAISGLRDQQHRLAAEIGTKVIEMHHAGNPAEPELLASIQAWDGLEQQIAQRESEKRAIEAEGAPAPAPAQPQAAAAAVTQAAPAAAVGQAYGHLCSKERTPIPAQAAFCPNCGAPAVDVPPPVAQSSTEKCVSCGATIKAGVAFCPECGAAQPRSAA